MMVKEILLLNNLDNFVVNLVCYLVKVVDLLQIEDIYSVLSILPKIIGNILLELDLLNKDLVFKNS
jgi:anthranilate/para-aminobenzoate synthase component II